MRIDIDQLSDEELVDLNNRIVQRLKFLEQARAHVAMLKFRIGDRVTFTATDRPPVVGILTKYNQKTVTVISDDGQKWNVSPSFLQLTPASDEESGGGKVIPIKSGYGE